MSCLSPVNSCGGIVLNPYTCYLNNSVRGKRLSQITTSSDKLNFLATVDRTDLDLYEPTPGLTSKKRLETIEIRNPVTDECYKKFQFSYSTMQSTGDPGESAYKRLILNSVQEVPCSGPLVVNPYVFTYYSGTLPHRLSKQTDHWGFYNGATGNETTPNIPPVQVVMNYASPLTPPYATANRSADTALTRIATLKRIAYPTKGYTDFSYSNNDYNAVVSTNNYSLLYTNS